VGLNPISKGDLFDWYPRNHCPGWETLINDQQAKVHGVEPVHSLHTISRDLSLYGGDHNIRSGGLMHRSGQVPHFNSTTQSGCGLYLVPGLEYQFLSVGNYDRTLWVHPTDDVSEDDRLSASSWQDQQRGLMLMERLNDQVRALFLVIAENDHARASFFLVSIAFTSIGTVISQRCLLTNPRPLHESHVFGRRPRQSAQTAYGFPQARC